MKLLSKVLLASVLGMLSLTGFAGSQKPLQFATEATYPPFEYIDQSGKIKGFDIDIAKALCTQMQRQCEFHNAPWDSLIPSLKLGKYDALIGAMAITAERKQQVAFTNPYYMDTVSFVAPMSEKLQVTPAGMKGKTIGVQGGTVLQQYLQSTYGSAVSVKTYASQEQALMDLQAGRVDAVLGDTPLVKTWLKQQKGSTYGVAGKPITDKKYFGQGFGIAVNKDNTQLVQQLNTALAAIKKNGQYQKIVTQYFGS